MKPGWTEVALGDVCEGAERRAPTGETFQYIDLGSIDQTRKVIREAATVQTKDAPSRARQLVTAGDVLVSTVRPNLGGVAVVEPDLDGATASTGFAVLRARDHQIDRRFLYQWVRAARFRDHLVARATGASYPAVTDQLVRQAPVPLPPIEEQRRIAAVLDRAVRIVDTATAIGTRIDELQHAFFLELWEPPVDADGWTPTVFDEVCPTHLGKMLDQKVQTGRHAKPYLRNQNVRWFRFDLDELASMDFAGSDLVKYRLHPGDVLICEGGEPGRAAIWASELDECFFQKALHRGRPDPNQVVPEFIVHWLREMANRGRLADHISTATISHLTGVKLKALPITVPPLALQHRFRDRLASLAGISDCAERRADRLTQLFASLQDRAFRGDL